MSGTGPTMPTVPMRSSPGNGAVTDMRRALEDLRSAINLATIMDDGTVAAYEIDGTATIITLAVNMLVATRNKTDV